MSDDDGRTDADLMYALQRQPVAFLLSAVIRDKLDQVERESAMASLQYYSPAGAPDSSARAARRGRAVPTARP